jgi:hypothetical protein
MHGHFPFAQNNLSLRDAGPILDKVIPWNVPYVELDWLPKPKTHKSLNQQFKEQYPMVPSR